MKGTVFLDHAEGHHFLIVREKEKDSKAWSDLLTWEGLILDGSESGEFRSVWDFELKHGRFTKVG